jgi:hypothetical protein
MALTQTDIDNLDAAIAAAELEVEIDGKRVKYRSMSDLKYARAHAVEVVQRAATTRSRSSYRFNFTTQRGD